MYDDVKAAIKLVRELAALDTVSMSPLEALTKVMELRRRAAQIVEDAENEIAKDNEAIELGPHNALSGY